MVVWKIFLLSTQKIGDMIQFDEHIFEMGWFNHQPDNEVLIDSFVCLFFLGGGKAIKCLFRELTFES